jgi:[ribosomal protein S5]-alanine N-acetyltransferase
MNITLHPISLNEDKTKPEYSSEDCQLLLKMWEEYYPKIGFHLPWVGYLVKRNNVIVGSVAFTGPPENNTVEVSYWTFKQFEAQGISTASCRQLISIAKETDPNIIVTAKTAPEKNASTSILEKCGFVFSGVVQDHEIGDAWGWVLGR